MTPEQINKVIALAGVLAVRRVRKFAQKHMLGPNETAEGTARGVVKATEALRKYLEELNETKGDSNEHTGSPIQHNPSSRD